MQNKMDNSKKSDHQSDKDANASHQSEKTKPKAKLTEIGGPKGPEPTRYGEKRSLHRFLAKITRKSTKPT